MSRQSYPLLSLEVIASGAIAEARFVTPAGAQAGAAVNTLGVARVAAADKDAIPVDVIGTGIVEAGAAIAAGSLVETDASGRAVTRAAGPIVARLAPGQVATAAGQFIEVILITN